MSDDLQKAYLAYLAIPEAACRCASHYTPIKKEDEFGEKFNVPKPDKEVCSRERAWRHYCNLRDKYVSDFNEKELKKNSLSESDKKWINSIPKIHRSLELS